MVKKRVGDFGRFAGHIGREKRELECNYGQKLKQNRYVNIFNYSLRKYWKEVH